MDQSTSQTSCAARTPRFVMGAEGSGIRPNRANASFRELWKKQYGQNITDEQAEGYEDRLVRLVKLLIDIEMEAKERAPP